MNMRGFILFGLTVVTSTALASEITVSRVQGEVLVRAGVQETWQSVKKGDMLKPHDSMRTGENSTAILLVSAEGKPPSKITLPSNVILDLSDVRTLTRDELILKLTMERVRSSEYDWKNSELEIPNATVVHGERKDEGGGNGTDEGTARLRMNGTRVLFQNGFFSTCALKGLSLMGRFPSLGETFENRYMIAVSLERSDLRGEALHEYHALSSLPNLTAEQQRLVRSGISRLRIEG